MRCPEKRKQASEARSLRTAIMAMTLDRFSPEEIAVGLECELSTVIAVMERRKEQRKKFWELKD